MPADSLAAVDLGSNSFHMVVAEQRTGELRVVDTLKSRVRLAAGLDDEGKISVEAQERALECLARFGQRLRDIPPERVRAVGTNTLRKARNGEPFLERANKALGHVIHVIPGREEARLIYQGVGWDIESAGRRLVIDIGGGSTEVICGEGPEILFLDSLYMGCVSFSQRFFPHGSITRAGMEAAVLAARRELEPVARRYRRAGYELAIGSSGTILACRKILVESGLSPEGITAAGLKKLRAELVEAGSTGKVKLAGLSPDRRPVLPGGLAILYAAAEELGIDRLETSNYALREGVLLDLVGRQNARDAREATVERAMSRWNVDRAQAARVQATTLALFDRVAEAWDMDERLRHTLAWAARLHECGLFVAWPGYHKHGAYLLEHAELPGFARDEQALLGALVRLHRGSLAPEKTQRSPLVAEDLLVLRAAALLRVATRLHRSRSPRALPAFSAKAVGNRLELSLPRTWLDDHPLTVGDLEEERTELAEIGLELALR